MKVLVLNSGSSSLKYQLFEMGDRVVLANGLVERIGDEGSRLVHRQAEGAGRQVTTPTGPIPDHREALDRIGAILTAAELMGKGEALAGIGHRVAHGQ